MPSIGLDIGTTGCKLTLYTGEGDRVGQYYQEYPARRQAGEHELDAAALWRAADTRRLVRDSLF